MSGTTTAAIGLDPLGIPDLDRASASFELLPGAEVITLAASSEWVSARVLAEGADAAQQRQPHPGPGAGSRAPPVRRGRDAGGAGAARLVHPVAVAVAAPPPRPRLGPGGVRRRGALRVAAEMVDIGQQMAKRSHRSEGVWADPSEALAGLTVAAVVTQIRACVAETMALRPFLEARMGWRGNQ